VTQPVDKFLMTYEQTLVFQEHFMGLPSAPVTEEKFSRGCSVCGQVQDFLLGRGHTVGGKDAPPANPKTSTVQKPTTAPWR